MRTFLVRTLVFSLVSFFIVNLVLWGLIQKNYHARFIENGQIYYAIKKSLIPRPSTDVFILGGSVADQMYNNREYNDGINSFCTVFPVTMAGHYLLLRSIISHNDMAGKRVVLISHPNGFSAEFNQSSLYHYLIKPFYNSSFLGYFDSYLDQLLSKVSYKWLVNVPMVSVSNWTPEKGQISMEKGELGMTYISKHYLLKMDSLAKAHHFTFEILPSILPMSEKENSFSDLKVSIKTNGLERPFQDYFNRIIYFEDRFFKDGYHLTDRSILKRNIFEF